MVSAQKLPPEEPFAKIVSDHCRGLSLMSVSQGDGYRSLNYNDLLAVSKRAFELGQTTNVLDYERRDCGLCKVPLGFEPCRHVAGVGSGRISMAESTWRRLTDELTRLRTITADWEDG